MFGSKKVDTVEGLLTEGENFVNRLEEAAIATQTNANTVHAKIVSLESEYKELERTAKKGRIVADKLSAILTVTEEELVQ